MIGVCRDVRKIKIERIQDATFRRIPFQKKIDAGLKVLIRILYNESRDGFETIDKCLRKQPLVSLVFLPYNRK